MAEAAAATTPTAPVNGATSATIEAAPKVKNGSSGTQTPNPSITTPTKPPEAGDKAATPPPQKFKAKVRGQEREWSPEELILHASKNVAAEEALYEAQKIRKAAEEKERQWAEREAKLKSKDFWEALREFGHDPDEAAKGYVLKKYGEPEPQAPLPPEVQKQLQELEALKKSQAEQTQKAEQQREEETRLRTREDYRQRFTAGLMAQNIAEDSPLVAPLIRRMAWHQEAAEESGYDIPPEALASLALKDFRGEATASWAGLEGDALLDEMGQEMTDRVVKAAVSRIERRRQEKLAGVAQPPPKVTRTETPPRGDGGKFVTREEAQFERFFKG